MDFERLQGAVETEKITKVIFAHFFHVIPYMRRCTRRCMPSRSSHPAAQAGRMGKSRATDAAEIASVSAGVIAFSYLWGGHRRMDGSHEMTDGERVVATA